MEQCQACGSNSVRERNISLFFFFKRHVSLPIAFLMLILFGSMTLGIMTIVMFIPFKRITVCSECGYEGMQPNPNVSCGRYFRKRAILSVNKIHTLDEFKREFSKIVYAMDWDIKNWFNTYEKSSDGRKEAGIMPHPSNAVLGHLYAMAGFIAFLFFGLGILLFLVLCLNLALSGQTIEIKGLLMLSLCLLGLPLSIPLWLLAQFFKTRKSFFRQCNTLYWTYIKYQTIREQFDQFKSNADRDYIKIVETTDAELEDSIKTAHQIFNKGEAAIGFEQFVTSAKASSKATGKFFVGLALFTVVTGVVVATSGSGHKRYRDKSTGEEFDYVPYGYTLEG